MGKRGRKNARSGRRDVTGNGETPANGVLVIKDWEECFHYNKRINIKKHSAKLRSFKPMRCEDCHGNVVHKRAKKGKGKHGKKGGASAKSQSNAIWVCLKCGHCACGGVELPTTPQSHALRHWKQYHHPLVVKYENHQLLWCFLCDKLVSDENSDGPKHKGVLDEVAEMMQRQLGSGSVTNAMKSDYSVSTGGISGYSIRGLCNLGNTCFFNSVVQNLLALNILRDYYFNLDEYVGPISAAMRMLFIETSNEAGSKGATSPISLFASICIKAPQFRGFQQHDSHELLRCLLDGLSIEELSFRKRNIFCEVSVKDPTFVDVVFGGQFLSTVRCLECGHSSTIYERFLDLSLPIPTKKPPPKRKQPPTQDEKPKLPPKTSARNLFKISNETNSVPRRSVFDQGISSNGSSSGEVYSTDQSTLQEELVLALCEFVLSDSTNDLIPSQNPENQPAGQTVEKQTAASGVYTLSDYLEPSNAVSDIDHTSVIWDSANGDDSSTTSDSSTESNLENVDPEISLDNAKENDAPEQGVVAEEQNASIQFEDEHISKPHSDERKLPEGSISGDRVECDGGKDQSSPSCSQVFDKDPSTSGMDNGNSLQILDPKVMSCQNQEAAKNGVNGNTSEYDADEVDNADAPVTVESCLALFTKTEFLCKDENAWHCDNCAKILREQTMKSKKVQKPMSDTVPNSCGDGRSCGMVKSVNGNTDTDPTDSGSLPQNGTEFQLENMEFLATVASNGSSECSDISNQNRNPVMGECDSEKDGSRRSDSQAVKHESEVKEHEDVDSVNLEVKRDATRSIVINKAPLILTIHLKRFSQDAGGELNKRYGHVSFKETMHLKEYMDPSCSEEGTSPYRLVGLVEHYGTMIGGHYVAYVRSSSNDRRGGGWFRVSDTFVREASLEEVMGSEAYILFYERS